MRSKASSLYNELLSKKRGLVSTWNKMLSNLSEYDHKTIAYIIGAINALDYMVMTDKNLSTDQTDYLLSL